MPEPILFVVDNDPATLESLAAVLERRFGADYRILTDVSPGSLHPRDQSAGRVRGRRRPPPSDERRRRRRRRRRHRGAFRLGVSQQGVTAQTATRASSVLVTNARSAESSDETGTERPASARASSVLEAACFSGTVAPGCEIGAAVNARASSVVVGIGFARATPAAAVERARAAASESPYFEDILLIVFIWFSFSLRSDVSPGQSPIVGVPSRGRGHKGVDRHPRAAQDVGPLAG